jgi:hypothetical protein
MYQALHGGTVMEQDNNLKKSASQSFLPHIHEFEGLTKFSDRHDHELYGKTIKTIGKGENHYHVFEGTTSFDDGHRHYLIGQTGIAIPIDFQKHIHRIEGKSSITNKHTHAFTCKSNSNIR